MWSWNDFFLNKFLFLFLSILQTQLLNSKTEIFYNKQTKKTWVQRQHAYKRVRTVLLIKPPSYPLVFLLPLNSIYGRNNNSNRQN